MDPGARNGLLNFESMQMTLPSLTRSYRHNIIEQILRGKKTDFKLGRKIDFVIFNGNNMT